MSSSLDREQPSEHQLLTARSHRRLLDALLVPDMCDRVAGDMAAHPGLQELIDAGLAVARVDSEKRSASVRLTRCGLTAALRILEDQP